MGRQENRRILKNAKWMKKMEENKTRTKKKIGKKSRIISGCDKKEDNDE